MEKYEKLKKIKMQKKIHKALILKGTPTPLLTKIFKVNLLVLHVKKKSKLLRRDYILKTKLIKASLENFIGRNTLLKFSDSQNMKYL